MGVRYEDLPKAMQEQVRAATGEPAPRKKDRKGATKAAIDGWCATCRMHFERERDWERHTAENEGHRRLEMVESALPEVS